MMLADSIQYCASSDPQQYSGSGAANSDANQVARKENSVASTDTGLHLEPCLESYVVVQAGQVTSRVDVMPLAVDRQHGHAGS